MDRFTWWTIIHSGISNARGIRVSMNIPQDYLSDQRPFSKVLLRQRSNESLVTLFKLISISFIHNIFIRITVISLGLAPSICYTLTLVEQVMTLQNINWSGTSFSKKQSMYRFTTCLHSGVWLSPKKSIELTTYATIKVILNLFTWFTGC